MICATMAIKKFIRHCIPDDIDLSILFMINIPKFACKDKYKSALYFDSIKKFIPRIEIYAYNSALGNDKIDLYWLDGNLIN